MNLWIEVWIKINVWLKVCSVSFQIYQNAVDEDQPNTPTEYALMMVPRGPCSDSTSKGNRHHFPFSGKNDTEEREGAIRDNWIKEACDLIRNR